MSRFYGLYPGLHLLTKTHVYTFKHRKNFINILTHTIHTYIYIYINVCVCVCACMCVCMYMYVCMYVHINILTSSTMINMGTYKTLSKEASNTKPLYIF